MQRHTLFKLQFPVESGRLQRVLTLPAGTKSPTYRPNLRYVHRISNKDTVKAQGVCNLAQARKGGCRGTPEKQASSKRCNATGLLLAVRVLHEHGLCTQGGVSSPAHLK